MGADSRVLRRGPVNRAVPELVSKAINFRPATVVFVLSQSCESL